MEKKNYRHFWEKRFLRVLIFCICFLALLGCQDFIFLKMMETSAAGTGELAISPISATLLINTKCVFTATGGNPPYIFSVAVGGGSIDSSLGIYTAPAVPGDAIIQVRDSEGAISEAVAIYVE
jgi:amino acid permease